MLFFHGEVGHLVAEVIGPASQARRRRQDHQPVGQAALPGERPRRQVRGVVPQRDRLAVVIGRAMRDFVFHTRLSGEICTQLPRRAGVGEVGLREAVGKLPQLQGHVGQEVVQRPADALFARPGQGLDVDQPQLGLRGDHDPRFAIPQRVGVLARQLADVIGQRGQLETEAAGVRFIGQQQVQQRRQLQRGHVAVAIGHGAVGDFQHRFQQRGGLGLAVDERLPQQPQDGQARVPGGVPCRRTASPGRGSCSRSSGR